jgi:hypothetical protein
MNREGIVSGFLSEFLPKAFSIESGLVLASNGQFSSQADLLIVDATWNRPFYGNLPVPVWLVEAVYALFEIKTNLNKDELEDSFNKCDKFKRLPRAFAESGMSAPRISDSLFVIWGFEAPQNATLKSNVLDLLAKYPREFQPDFIVVPDRTLIACGQYVELTRWGQPSSPFRTELKAKAVAPKSAMPSLDPLFWDLSVNALFVFFVFLQSWLAAANRRSTNLISYLPTRKWGDIY